MRFSFWNKCLQLAAFSIKRLLKYAEEKKKKKVLIIAWNSDSLLPQAEVASLL